MYLNFHRQHLIVFKSLLVISDSPSFISKFAWNSLAKTIQLQTCKIIGNSRNNKDRLNNSDYKTRHFYFYRLSLDTKMRIFISANIRPLINCTIYLHKNNCYPSVKYLHKWKIWNDSWLWADWRRSWFLPLKERIRHIKIINLYFTCNNSNQSVKTNAIFFFVIHIN